VLFHIYRAWLKPRPKYLCMCRYFIASDKERVWVYYLRVCMWESVCERVYVRKSVCVCEREGEFVCKSVYLRDCVCVCERACMWERDCVCVCVWERERERVYVRVFEMAWFIKIWNLLKRRFRLCECIHWLSKAYYTLSILG